MAPTLRLLFNTAPFNYVILFVAVALPLTILAALTPPRALAIRNNGATMAFADPVTNISFQRFSGAKSGSAFGIALPQNPNDSFIGQMSFPLAAGAAGWSLASDREAPSSWPPEPRPTARCSPRPARPPTRTSTRPRRRASSPGAHSRGQLGQR
ncbi:hypothetical protein LX36DRAFT_664584 [Colletotrichum falcatum]|nr:hypothetical protein LX36DRAFT_664584 [Colletotrichum falcatum]